MTEIYLDDQIYGDSTVLITDSYIKIYKYYFPLATSKTILYDEIDQIIYHRGESVTPIWGIQLKHLNNWFPLDEIRKYKTAFFQIILKGQAIRPSFSPIQPQRAFWVLWKSHTKQGKKYLEQAKIAQQQLISPAKQVNQQQKQTYSQKVISPAQPARIQNVENKGEERVIFADKTNKISNQDQNNDEHRSEKIKQDSKPFMKYIDFFQVQNKENELLHSDSQFESLE